MDDVFPNLAEQVQDAVQGFANDHPTMAHLLGWPVGTIRRYPQLAENRVRRIVTASAVLPKLGAPVAQPQSAPPGPLERAGESLRHSVDQTYEAVTNPAQAMADYIAARRGSDRVSDVLGGSLANLAADLPTGLAEASDLSQKYLLGGVLQDEFASHGIGVPTVKAAPWMYRATAPLREEAAKRPPKALWEKVVAGIPTAGVAIAAPEVLPALLGARGLGSSYDQAQRAGVTGMRADAGIAATGALDAASGALQIRILRGSAMADAFARVPETLKGPAVKFITWVAATSGLNAGLAAAQRTGENALARLSVDPNRPLGDGVGDSAAVAGLMAAPFGAVAAKASVEPNFEADVQSEVPRPFVTQQGGAWKDIEVSPGYQRHHMPANSISPLSREAGPAIRMELDDHTKTASWGPYPDAKVHRARQADLIRNGDFAGAQDIDIEDIRALFGNKYDDAIEQMLQHSRAKGLRR
jgi:hypothetical protein